MKTHKITIRETAEHIVDMYLKVILSSDKDAGWQGDNLIGKLIDFKGELPQSSGFSGFSKVWEQTALLRDFPKKFRVAVRLMHTLSDRQRQALCVDRWYRGRIKATFDDAAGSPRLSEKRWSDHECAKELGCTERTFRRRIEAGYQRIEAVICPAYQQLAA